MNALQSPAYINAGAIINRPLPQKPVPWLQYGDKTIVAKEYMDNLHTEEYIAIIVIAHDGTTQGSFPTLSNIIKRFKTITTKLYIDGVKNNVLSIVFISENDALRK